MSEEPVEGMAMVPRAIPNALGVNFFEDSVDPVIIMNILLPLDASEGTLVHVVGDRAVLPVAITPTDLQALIPEITEAVIRARTIMELTTIYPERRDEMLANLAFRWGGVTGPSEDGDGPPA